VVSVIVVTGVAPNTGVIMPGMDVMLITGSTTGFVCEGQPISAKANNTVKNVNTFFDFIFFSPIYGLRISKIDYLYPFFLRRNMASIEHLLNLRGVHWRKTCRAKRQASFVTIAESG
jgi:hypothetical protein